MTKRDKGPRKTDPFPCAARKVAMGKYDLYRGCAGGEYRVYPDGRIVIEDMERFRAGADRERAARTILAAAIEHAQKIEEEAAKVSRRFWEEFFAARGVKYEVGWSLDAATGEVAFTPPAPTEPDKGAKS